MRNNKDKVLKNLKKHGFILYEMCPNVQPYGQKIPVKSTHATPGKSINSKCIVGQNP